MAYTNKVEASTALYLACSVWGNPKQFYRTWRATGNALEHTAYMHNDSFLVLDEIGEIANPKEIGNIVYMLANGLGKGRMTKQITAKPMHQWKIIFLSSGEKSLKDIMQEQGQKTKLGQEIRLSDIDIDQNPYGIFDQIDFAEDGAKQSIELIQRMNGCYGVAGIAWLEHLTANKPHLMEQARQLFDEYRNALTVDQQQGHIKRVASYFAVVAVAGELASQAQITGWQTGTAFHAVHKVFQHWLNGFEKIGDYEDREILAHVKAFFEKNGASAFEFLTPDPSHPEKIINRAGYKKVEGQETLYLVFAEQFKKEICKGYDYKKVQRILKQHQWLNCNASEHQKSERIPDFNQPVRMYVFNENMWAWSESTESQNNTRNIRNTRNSLDAQGFGLLRSEKPKHVTRNKISEHDQPKALSVTSVTETKNPTRNKLNPSHDGRVTCVTPVTVEKNLIPDHCKKSAKTKLVQPEKIDTQTIDMFGGLV